MATLPKKISDYTPVTSVDGTEAVLFSKAGANGAATIATILANTRGETKIIGQTNADIIVANNANISTVLNNLIVSMSNAGQYGTIYVKKGTYKVNSTIILYPGINIVGDGQGNTIFVAANGLNDDVFRTYKFSEQTDHNYVGYDSAAKYLTIQDIEIQGNSAQQTASNASDPRDMRTLIKLYGYKLIVNRVMLRDAKETAFYSEFSNNQPVEFENYETLPNRFNDIDIKGFNTYGFVYRGPHDSYLSHIFAATSGANIAGILIEQGANFGVANTHIFESYANGAATQANVWIKGGPSVTGDIYGEGNTSGAAFDITGNSCNLELTAGYSTVGYIIRGNGGNATRNRLQLGLFFDEPPTAIKLDGNVQYNDITLTQGFPDNVVFDTSNYSGGNNHLVARTYGKTMFSTPANVGKSDWVEIISDNYPDDGRQTNFRWPVADRSFGLVSTGTDKYIDADTLPIRNVGPAKNSGDALTLANIGKARNTFNVLDYGAKVDGRRLEYVAIAAGSKNVTCNSANFTAADVGKIAVLYREIPDTATGTGKAVQTTIASVTDSGHAVLNDASAITMNGNSTTFMIIGTDDSAAVQAASVAAAIAKPAGLYTDPNNPYGAGQSELYIPANGNGTNGICLIANQISIKSTVRLDAQAMLVNVTSSTTIPFIIFESYTSAKRLTIEACYNAGIQSGNNNGWQSHNFFDDIIIWHTGNAVDQYAIKCLGYDHTFKRIYLKNAYVGVWHESGSDFHCDELFAIGVYTAFYLKGSSQVHYSNVFIDTGRGIGAIIDAGSGNVYARVKAFEASGTTFSTSPVVQVGGVTTTVNRDIVLDIQADNTGGSVLSVANANDLRATILASNQATLYGATNPITTAVVYGSGVTNDISIDAQISTGITPFTGTKAGTFTYTQGGVRNFTSPISLNNNKITDVATPTAANDVANKSYVDASISAGGGSGSVADATTTSNGVLRLSNDLGGTAAAPTTPTAVHLAGAETVTGAKTFSANPVIASGASLLLYNTADTVTNYDRLRLGVNANIWELFSESAGTGTVRNMRWGSANQYLNFIPTANTGGPKMQYVQNSDTTGSLWNLTTASGFGLNSPTSYQYGMNVSFTTKQSGSAGYTAYLANITESSVGTGDHNLIDLQVAGVTKFKVDSTGTPKIPLNAFNNAVLKSDQYGNASWGSVATATVPATATSNGTAGTIAYDSNYMYICTAANTWKRVAIATW